MLSKIKENRKELERGTVLNPFDHPSRSEVAVKALQANADAYAKRT